MSRQEQLIEYITDDIVSFIMEDFKVPVLEAMQRLYTSETFSKLNNVETGLYLESSAYVYDIFPHIFAQSVKEFALHRTIFSLYLLL